MSTGIPVEIHVVEVLYSQLVLMRGFNFPQKR